MSVEESGKIDFIGTDDAVDTVVLTVSDHLEWGNSEHLPKLQEKLNAYLRFVESGEIYGACPESRGKKIRIDIKFKYSPDAEGEEFLNGCTDAILSAGFQFTYGVA